MALTNAEKQARWRNRNIISLTERSADIAWKLIEMGERAKLVQISKLINEYLKHPEWTPEQRAIAFGYVTIGGLTGRLSKGAALKAAALTQQPTDSFRIEPVTGDGQRRSNGVRLGTLEEAKTYADQHARYEIDGYVTSDIIRCDGEPPLNSVTRNRKGGRSTLHFEHGTCVGLNWRPMAARAATAAVNTGEEQ